VRLGEGGKDENHISEAAFARGLEALGQLKSQAEALGAEAICALGTMALRSAQNGGGFVEAARKATGVHINLIDGEEEARLVYRGVQEALEFDERTTLIMDIGGGSTEFILRRQGEVAYLGSFAIGCSRLLTQFRPADPILAEEIAAVEEHLEEQLEPLIAAAKGDWPRVLVGSSGSFDTLAQMCTENFAGSPLDPEARNYTFDLHQYSQISRRMLASNFDERLQTPGMIPMRADMIVMACVQINFVMRRLGIKTLRQSAYALKEGVFRALIENPRQWQKS